MKKKNYKSKIIFLVIFWLVFIAVVTVFACFLSLAVSKLYESYQSRQNFSLERKTIQPIKVVDEQSQVISVVEKASPTVVSIIASAEVPAYEQYYEDVSPWWVPEEFRDLFDYRVPSTRENGVQIAAATGFIVSADGYIITNKHVVDEENAEYTVILNNKEGEEEKIIAKVLARHPDNDIAILKIDKENLPYLEFGDSNVLKVGQTAIAIGYALGEFDNSVSKGVISGLARSLTAGGYNFGTENLKDLIQTDAAINLGNSGGPLLNIKGEVIGVNVAMADAQSIGFAIPANIAYSAFLEVKETGQIKKKEVGFLGVRYMPVTKELKEANNLSYDYGALVVRGETREELAVMPGSPADKAGITENDIILEVDGKKVTTKKNLGDLISEYKPGNEVELKIFHKGEEKKVKVVLGKK